jgi:alkylhydroperoxidase family enzyme
VDAVCRDPATAPIPAREKALFAYLGKLVDTPGSMTQADADALAAAGWSDAEAFDAVTVCSLFSFFNRWIDGTGVPDVPKGFYEARLERHGDMGYAPSS